MADRGDAPMVPVVSRNVSGPQEGLGVPGVDIKSKGLFDGFVVVVFVRTVSVGAKRWSGRAASNCWRAVRIEVPSQLILHGMEVGRCRGAEAATARTGGDGRPGDWV